MSTVLIESNRAIANSIIKNNEQQIGIVDIRHKQVSNNANWSTTLNSGIELQPGDQISMESCALNVLGAGGGSFLEFNGSDDTSLPDGTFKSDNKAEIEIAYYVNNNCQFNCPLPKGSATIVDCNIQLEKGLIAEDFGAVDLTGKNIWGLSFPPQEYPIISSTLNLGNQKTEFPLPSLEWFPCPVGTDKARKLQYWAFNDGWSMNRNGYFSKNNNPNTLTTPSSAVGVAVFEKTNTLDHFGFVSWCENTPQKGITGVCFGQNNMSLDNTFNENILNKNSNFNRVTTEANNTADPPTPRIPGGAAPYLIQSFNKQNNILPKCTTNEITVAYNGMYEAACNNIGATFLPQRFIGFQRDEYEDIVTYYPTTYKGGGFNNRPNNNRLYCSELYINNNRNQGPYYRIDTNNLITTQSHQTSHLLNFRTRKRDNKTFNFLQSTLELDLGTGNLAPSRVAEIITEQMKERTPDMAHPDNLIGIGAEVFITYKLENPGASSGPINESREPVLRKNIAQLTSKTYTTYPTINGYCWNAKVTQPINSVFSWDAIEKEQCIKAQLATEELEEGNHYNVSQAYEKFYANMLVGNPYEWKTVCSIQPVLQACPMTFVSTNEATFNYENHSILAGFDNGFAVTREIPTSPPTQNTTDYKVGNLGNFPCLINLDFSYNTMYSLNSQKSYVCSWYNGNFIASASYVADSPATPVNPTLNYNMECLNCKNYQMYDTACRRPILDVQDMDIFATNIIFDGQLQLDIFDENMDKIKKHGNRHHITKNADSLESQSPEFFNNTFVDWVIGRIDDQYSYPENESMNLPPFYNNPQIAGSTFTPASTGKADEGPDVIRGREGTPIFLPNIFQTNNLYDGNLKDAGSASVVINTTQEMKDLFSIYKRNVTFDGSTFLSSGSYMMRNMRVGYNENDHTKYTVNNNPQSVFNKGTSAGFYNPTTDTDPGRTPAFADNFFGIPCYSTYAEDFQGNDRINSNTSGNTAYQKGCRRSIEAYRYLPQNKNREFNVYSAFNKTLSLGATTDQHFTTCPDTYTFEKLKSLWDKITALNKGKGIGLIPIFYKKSALTELATKYPKLVTATKNDLKILEIPFVGIISQGLSYNNIPVPALGEYIMLGSTSSLQQNDLHHPFTTQQSNTQVAPFLESFEGGKNVNEEYITNYCGIQSFKAITRAIPPNAFGNDNIGKYSPTIGQVNTRISANEGKSISNIIYVGANDPIMNFDNTFNRFTISNLHTQLFKGNGVFQLASFGPDANPNAIEAVVKNTNCAVSQQVDLPAGYFQKFDDTRNVTTGGDKWMLFNLRRTTGTFYGRDKYIPGRVTGGTFGTGAGDFNNRGIVPLMTNSIDGNVIRQTFDASVFGPGTKDPQAVPLEPEKTDVTRKPGDIFHNNFEPGGLQSYDEALAGQILDPSNATLGNVLPFVPFNATQFTLRLLNQENIITGEFNNAIDSNTRDALLSPTLRPYAYVKQDSTPYLYNSSQAGISILGMNIVKSNDVEKITLSNTDYDLFEGSLFYKLGYELNQILPLFSQVQTQYNHTLFNKFQGPNKSAFQAYNNMIAPVTTNAINSSSGVPSSVGGFGTASSQSSTANPNTLMPMFNLGGIWTSGAIVGNSDFLLAQRLPTRLSFPYLVLRSNIATPCGNQYIGGPNGQQLLPAISYLMTSYASDDYFYNYRSDLVFTVNKPYVLTELVSSIHFPNGKLATNILGLNTAVIYRIDFAQRVPQIPQQIQEKENEKDKKK